MVITRGNTFISSPVSAEDTENSCGDVGATSRRPTAWASGAVLSNRTPSSDWGASSITVRRSTLGKSRMIEPAAAAASVVGDNAIKRVIRTGCPLVAGIAGPLRLSYDGEWPESGGDERVSFGRASSKRSTHVAGSFSTASAMRDCHQAEISAKSSF